MKQIYGNLKLSLCCLFTQLEVNLTFVDRVIPATLDFMEWKCVAGTNVERSEVKEGSSPPRTHSGRSVCAALKWDHVKLNSSKGSADPGSMAAVDTPLSLKIPFCKLALL